LFHKNISFLDFDVTIVYNSIIAETMEESKQKEHGSTIINIGRIIAT